MEVRKGQCLPCWRRGATVPLWEDAWVLQCPGGMGGQGTAGGSGQGGDSPSLGMVRMGI